MGERREDGDGTVGKTHERREQKQIRREDEKINTLANDKQATKNLGIWGHNGWRWKK